MEKKIRRRGRPTIEAWMDDLIVSRVLAEKNKASEERTPRNILAYEIQEEIKKKTKVHERLPKISTLEKRISTFSKKVSSEDDPWTIGTLGDYPISSETLPIVLALCKYVRGAGNIFAIRQAKWTARLSGVLRDQPLWYLWYWTCRYAGAELVSQLLDRPFDTASLDDQVTDPKAKQKVADQLKNQLTTWERISAREQSGKEYPPAIWGNDTGEQSENPRKTKKQTKNKGGTK